MSRRRVRSTPKAMAFAARLPSSTMAVLLAAALGATVRPLPAEEPTATVPGHASQVAVKQIEGALLLNLQQTAAAFGFTAKIVAPGKLVVLCRDEEQELCVPIRLDAVQSASGDQGLYVEADALARTMGFSVQKTENRISLLPRSPQALHRQVAAYNANWGPGRGFEVGQTLPDIPLYDMQGREVRFSRFLGQKYILYCWASW